MSSAPRWMWKWELIVVLWYSVRCITGAATALSVTPSTNWFGDDGTWSAISIRVGTPPQWVDVMVNTVSSETWVVGPAGCVDNNALCISSRGEIFDMKKSSTWQDEGFFNLGIDSRFGGSAYANYGLDDLAFGSTGVVLPSAIIGSINATSFLLGMFGLGVVPGNFKNITSLPAISGLVEKNGAIPSHSYGYTAGATYQQKGVPNSLTLGGFDANRFVPHNVSFNLNPSQNPQASISYISVVSAGSSNNWTSPVQLLSAADRVSAIIDSTTPYLWLPPSVCDRFAQTLGLSYNSSLELYTFDGNSSQHDVLQKSQLSFTFSLSDISASPEAVNITLPYAAFDLKLTFPFPALNTTYGAPDSSKNYFPLKRAVNEAQYTIGRAFLQEAYLITDYERNKFSIHQAIHTTNPIGDTNIVAITRPSDSSFSSPKVDEKSSSKLATGAIVGIAIGSCAAIALATILAFYFRHQKQAKAKAAAADDEKPEAPQPKSFLDRFRRRRPTPPANEVVGCTDYPTEVGADATHERFELPAPLGPAELDSDAGTLDGTTENGSVATDSNMSMYERARRKIERQQAAAARLEATHETYPIEKTENDTSPVTHYRPHDSDTLNTQSPLVSPMAESHGSLTVGGQPSPLSPCFVSAPTTPISPTSPPPTYRRISPGNVVYAGRLPDNVQLPRVVPRIIGPDGRTVNAEQNPVSPEPGTETTSTLGSQFTENEVMTRDDLYEDATQSPGGTPYSPVSSRSADGSAHGSASISAPTTTTGSSSNASQPPINIRGGGGGSDTGIVREEDDSKFLRQDVEGLRADIQTREVLNPYARRNRLQGEDDLVHVPQPAEHRFSWEEERISGTDESGTR
ncbi:Acid protease [Venustampulla echinocandica]|uniref:Acid protease n=1 Tax=Venustampulla echinocandica TaxID=2656787 RepID=A0A370T9K3_9HELO|nr:Acid protease [Venustampulla echinocandica]RDL30347.1 Acid protease [Venustampulla echinocandica]